MQFEVPIKGNVSGYVCNHGFPSGERDTASPRLCVMLRTQASDEEVDDVCSRCPLYCGRAGSDVIGCRRPTGGVFICMLQTWVTLTAFPIATPRGRSVSFPTRGTMVTYVTWDVLCYLGYLCIPWLYRHAFTFPSAWIHLSLVWLNWIIVGQ